MDELNDRSGLLIPALVREVELQAMCASVVVEERVFTFGKKKQAIFFQIQKWILLPLRGRSGVVLFIITHENSGGPGKMAKVDMTWTRTRFRRLSAFPLVRTLYC